MLVYLLFRLLVIGLDFYILFCINLLISVLMIIFIVIVIFYVIFN